MSEFLAQYGATLVVIIAGTQIILKCIKEFEKSRFVMVLLVIFPVLLFAFGNLLYPTNPVIYTVILLFSAVSFASNAHELYDDVQKGRRPDSSK